MYAPPAAMTPPTLSYLTDVWFAPGIAAETPGVMQRLNIRRPLLVTDKGVRGAGLLDALNVTQAAIFDAVETNPTEASVADAVEIYRAHGCDGVLAVGGGSP